MSGADGTSSVSFSRPAGSSATGSRASRPRSVTVSVSEPGAPTRGGR